MMRGREESPEDRSGPRHFSSKTRQISEARHVTRGERFLLDVTTNKRLERYDFGH